MHYVIGDVHGCYDEMMALIKLIEENDNDAKIIFVGDLIDRGPDVIKVLNWAMEHITSDGKYQGVRGNHEQMVIEWYQEFLKWWENQETPIFLTRKG
ncbi:MAG: metallophosphoesterase [Lachnospiraceae bacterium]|nr:metallophosphoesterase [Lachnospiraceae bacterium]